MAFSEAAAQTYILIKEKNYESITYQTDVPTGGHRNCGSLESLQKEVGGMIQATYPWDDKVALICNDEGKLLGLEFNRPLYNADAQIYDYVVGTFLIVGLTEDDFGSLSDEMIEKYTRMFRRCYGLLEDEDGKRYIVCMKPKQ